MESEPGQPMGRGLPLPLQTHGSHSGRNALAKSDMPLPPNTMEVNLLGVDYAHLRMRDGSDLYLTKYGKPFWRHLQPENWLEKDWFESKRERLAGTSVVYKVPTKKLAGASLQMVVKWSRVGEDIPMDTITIAKFINAEFNSPFEEFSLLMELRAGGHGPPGIRMRTQKPLAIYVPSKRLQQWQTGRSESKIAAKLARHPRVEIDILRQYVVLFGWIDGVDLVQAADLFHLRGQERVKFLERAGSLAVHELELKGYQVIDMKPAHIIVRTRQNNTLLRDHRGHLVYALIDYELMERTAEHENCVRSQNRHLYLEHMARRFEIPSGTPMPAHLKSTKVLGIDYVFGHAESTGGLIWVVGNDPALFNYFLPERWRRTPKIPLSSRNQVIYTRTKDNINLVWRVSRLGEMPSLPGDGPRERQMIDHGFNSPFEEFAHALQIGRAGVKTIYPRAIYMTGNMAHKLNDISDPRRYEILAHLRTPEEQPILQKNHDYITIWGFWNGPDELLAARDGQYYESINAKNACQAELIFESQLDELLDLARTQLIQIGFEHLNLKPEHLLLSLAPDRAIVCGPDGEPDVRLCNFELVRRLPCATT